MYSQKWNCAGSFTISTFMYCICERFLYAQDLSSYLAVRTHFQFLHSCICERYIFIPRIGLPILLVSHGLVDCKVHCTENPIYVFPEMKLRGLIPNSYTFMYLWAIFIFLRLVCLFGCADSFPIPTYIYLWAINIQYIPRIGLPNWLR